MNHYH